MSIRATIIGIVTMLIVAFSTLEGSGVSKQQAESLARKLLLIGENGSVPSETTRDARRTALSESEVNSWFTYNAPPLLPTGVTQPTLTIVGDRKVIGIATVDLDAVAKSRSSGGMFDVWNLIGGRVPVRVSGLLHAQGGRARFEMQSADVSGIPVPRRVVQDLVDYYSRTPDRPKGIRLDDSFNLPAGIQRIEISPGAAVVVQ